jgi:hypothetical protein
MTTMWRIVQKYAEYEMVTKYNYLLNYFVIILYHGIPTGSVSKAFIRALQDAYDSNPLRELMEGEEPRDVASTIELTWQDHLLDLIFFWTIFVLVAYLLLAVTIETL